MKVIIGNVVYDSDLEPITLVFKDDEQRKLVVKHLAQMPHKEGIRLYTSYPSDGQKILNNALRLLNETGE